jgi:hypothetical protein
MIAGCQGAWIKNSGVLTLIGLAISIAPCQASMILFDTGSGDAVTFRSADSGPGQPIFALNAVTITSMAMALAMPDGGDIKYMIWDGTDHVLLFSEEQAVVPSTLPVFVKSEPFSFSLTADSTYYFGVIGDNNLNVQFITPSIPVTQNGLQALLTGNSNYEDFALPTPVNPGFVEVTLQLYNGSENAVVPEPANWLAMCSGVILVMLLGLFMKVRRRSSHTL